MADRKGYVTVYWGKMPVNFRPQDFPKHEVEAAIGYAEGSFRDVAGLVPDFSVLTLGRDLGREETAVLVLGDEREARDFRLQAGEGASRGCCGRLPYTFGRASGVGACSENASAWPGSEEGRTPEGSGRLETVSSMSRQTSGTPRRS